MTEKLTSVFHCRWVFAAVGGSLLSPPPSLLCAPPSFWTKKKKKQQPSESQHGRDNACQCVVLLNFQYKSYFTLSVGSMSISISFPVRVWKNVNTMCTSTSALMKVLWQTHMTLATQPKHQNEASFTENNCPLASALKGCYSGLQSAQNKAAGLVLGGASRSNTTDKHAYLNWFNIEKRPYLFIKVKPWILNLFLIK